MILSHLPGPANNPAPGFAQLQAIKTLHLDKLYRDTAPLPFSNFIYRDYFSAVYYTCTATAPTRNKTCTWTAKSTPYLSCHRDHFPAKVPGPVAGWLRQVTQPPFIAGPLSATFTLRIICSANLKLCTLL
jgi:hypothetical protein